MGLAVRHPVHLACQVLDLCSGGGCSDCGGSIGGCWLITATQLHVAVKSSMSLFFRLVPSACFVYKTGGLQQEPVIVSEAGQICLDFKHLYELVHILIQCALEHQFAFECSPWNGVSSVSSTVW